MDGAKEGRINVLMLPFLSHGHICPFFELAKQLAKRNFKIFICSTPSNLACIKNKISDGEPSISSIQLVEIHLPSFPDLPPHRHTSNGLPPHLLFTLINAFQTAGPTFSELLKTLNPDLLIYDFFPPWAPEMASSHNIPAVYFLITASATSSLGLHCLKRPGDQEFPFPQLYAHGNETPQLPEDLAEPFDYIVRCFERSCDIVLVKSFRELEGKYIDFNSGLVGKTMIPVGSLVQDPTGEHEDSRTDDIINWLDKKDQSSVVFVCFGSEIFPTEEELEEMANGLEMSKVDFIWAVRSPEGETKTDLVLPEGFAERVGERGLVVNGWAPQVLILGHPSVGGFVSHCGWSSLMESMKFGVPIAAMPMRVDQPINAKLAVDFGVAVEVVKDKNGKFNRKDIAEVIRNVVVEKNGEVVRRKARELGEKIRQKGEEEMDGVVEELVKICSKNK